MPGYRQTVRVPENQLCELRAWCSNSGHTIVQEYIERQSGRRGADKRQRFAALLDAAARRKFDCVLFWALDRFSREGMAQTIAHLQREAKFAERSHSEQRRARHHMPSPKRWGLIDTLQPSTRSHLPERSWGIWGIEEGWG